MIRLMKQGSVVVDLAAESGGNFETTRLGEIYTDDNGITHIGYFDFSNRLPTQTSSLYANNITKFLLSIGDKENFFINLNDEVVRGSIVLHKGQLLWPSLLSKTLKSPVEVKKPEKVSKELEQTPDFFIKRLQQAAIYGAGKNLFLRINLLYLIKIMNYI